MWYVYSDIIGDCRLGEPDRQFWDEERKRFEGTKRECEIYISGFEAGQEQGQYDG